MHACVCVGLLCINIYYRANGCDTLVYHSISLSLSPILIVCNFIFHCLLRGLFTAEIFYYFYNWAREQFLMKKSIIVNDFSLSTIIVHFHIFLYCYCCWQLQRIFYVEWKNKLLKISHSLFFTHKKLTNPRFMYTHSHKRTIFHHHHRCTLIWTHSTHGRMLCGTVSTLFSDLFFALAHSQHTEFQFHLMTRQIFLPLSSPIENSLILSLSRSACAS